MNQDIAPASDAIAGSRSDRTQAGSAYIVSLLVLVVLTVLGLGLALITQTEMEIGANERTMQRLFYAADSGISQAVARTVTGFDCRPMLAEDALQIPDLDSISSVFQRVESSPVMPVLDPPCPLCTINNSGGAQGYGGDSTYFNVQHIVTVDAQRVVPLRPAQGQRTVSAFLSLQPWPKIMDCYAFANTPEAERIKM
jgi:hypothetical protein